MPPVHQRVISYLLALLRELSNHSSVTRMTRDNLCMIFGPCFLRCPYIEPDKVFFSLDKQKEVVEFLFDNLQGVGSFSPFMKIALTCAKCGIPFERKEPKMSALGALWHSNCFNCVACSKPFKDSFKMMEGKPYHIEVFFISSSPASAFVLDV